MGNDTKRTTKARNRRYHHRLPMQAPITIDFGDEGQVVEVQNLDVSWGGIRFAISKGAMPQTERITVNFPWTQGRSFSVDAEVLRTEYLDDRHDAVAARFSRLSIKAQQRLDKLLELLHGSDEATTENGSLVPVLEVLISDDDEVHAKLDELAAGQLTVTVFETYEVNQSIRLIIGGISDRPPLRLRARIAEIEVAPTGEDSAWAMFNLKLRFEHPQDELKALARALSKEIARSSKKGSDPFSDPFFDGTNRA